MKQYRITYNPYEKKTTVEEHYDDGAVYWSKLGGAEEAELENILNRGEAIQFTGKELLHWIEKHNKQFAEGRQYELLFKGIRQDYEDFCKICEWYKEKLGADTSFQKLVEPPLYLDNPVEIQESLQEACQKIQKIYDKDYSLKEALAHQIAEAERISETELNVLVVGLQNSGKSTLINALLEKELLPVSSDVETATLFTIYRSEQDKIEFINNNDECVEIRVQENSFEYSLSGTQWDRILDNIKDKISDEVSCQHIKGRADVFNRVLCSINDLCKKGQGGQGGQNSQAVLDLKEIRIGLSDFQIANSTEKFCIKDFPGAGGDNSYLGDAHKKIINDGIAHIKNAVILYVLKHDDTNLEAVQDFKKSLLSLNEQGSEGINNQIDFGHSIYVITKADAADDFEKTQKSIRRSIGEKKAVFVSAKAAFLMHTNSIKREPGLYGKFVKIPEDLADNNELTDLQQWAMLPPSYTAEQQREMSVEMAKGKSYSEPLARTGVPLVAALLDDYTKNISAVHKVRCYYNAVANMLKMLNEEENKLSSQLDEAIRKRETQQDAIRNELKTKCDNKCQECIVKLTKEVLQSQLTRAMERLVVPVRFNADKIKTYKKNKDTKKIWKEKIEEDINRSIRSIINNLTATGPMIHGNINYVEQLQEEICWYQDVINCTASSIQEVLEDMRLKQVAYFKKELLQEIQLNDLEQSEIRDLQKFIMAYSTGSLQYEQFEMPEKFKFSGSGINEFVQMVFRHTDWQIIQVKETVAQYWDKNIFVPVIDRLMEEIPDTYVKIRNYVQNKMDEFSPQLISMQNNIIQKKKELETLQEKIDESNSVKKECENVIAKGMRMPCTGK